MADKLCKNFINGEWVESKSGQTFENRNPADTDDLVGIFQKSNADDVKDAMEGRNRRGAIMYVVYSCLYSKVSLFFTPPGG